MNLKAPVVEMWTDLTFSWKLETDYSILKKIRKSDNLPHPVALEL